MVMFKEERNAVLKEFSNPKRRRSNWAIIRLLYEELLDGGSLNYFDGAYGVKFTHYVIRFIEAIKNYGKKIV